MSKASLICLVVLLSGAAAAQLAAVHDGNLALEFPSPRRPGSAWYVDYTSYDQQPALRAAVHHFHAACDGYLYVTPTRLVYVPAFSPEQKDSFDVLLQNVSHARPRFSGIEFQALNQLQKFAFLSGDASGGAQAGQAARTSLVELLLLAISDFKAAQARFAAALVGNSPPASGASAGLDIAAPQIKVLSPAGVADGKLVEAGSAAPRILGYAAAPSEIRSLLINNVPASTRPLLPNVAEFVGNPISFPSEILPVDIRMSTAGGEAQLAFRLQKAVVQWPHIPLETRSATYKLDGRLLGYGRVSSVEVDGHPARLQGNPDGTTEFLVDLPLQVGENAVTGVLTTAQGVRENFPVTIQRFRRLSLQDIKTGLHTLATRRLLDLISERGVDFPLDGAAQRELRAAGAGSEVLRAIAEAERD
jgi:hypothetical protein